MTVNQTCSICGINNLTFFEDTVPKVRTQCRFRLKVYFPAEHFRQLSFECHERKETDRAGERYKHIYVTITAGFPAGS